MSSKNDEKLLKKKYPMATLLKIVTTATLSCFVTGYNIGVTNSSLLNVEIYLDSSLSLTVFSSIHGAIFALGGTIGSLISGKMANYYGRRKGMMILCFLTFGTCGITIIPTVATFFIGRFMAGITAGIGVSIPPLYIGEIVPEAIRGKLGSLVQFTLTFGILASNLLCVMLPVYRFDSWTNNLWFFVYAFPAFPALIQLLILAFIYNFDTPKWLQNSQMPNEQERALKTIYAEDWEDYLDKETSIELKSSKKDPTFKEIFSIKKLRVALLVGCFLSMTQQLTGINAFIFYSSNIFEDLQGDKNFANLFTAAIGFVNMCSTMICLSLVEKFGRKLLMIQGLIGMGCCHLLLFLFNIVGITSVASLPFIFLFIAFFESSSGPVLWIYCGETLTDRGNGMAVSVNWFFTGVVTALFTIAVENISLQYVFLIFGAYCFGSTVVVIMFMKETKGKTRDEIDIMLEG